MQRVLVVVDMQNDFVTGSLGFPKATQVVPRVAHIIKKHLQAGSALVMTLDTHDLDYLNTREGRHLPIPHCERGTAGWEPVAALQPYMNQALVLEKEGFGLSSHEIARLCTYLEGMGKEPVSEIYICGLVSNICVIANAVVLQAAYPQAQLYIYRDATDSFDPELHEASLQVMQGLQCKLITMDTPLL